MTLKDVNISELHSGELINYYKQFGLIERFAVVSLGPSSESEGVVKVEYASSLDAEKARAKVWKDIRDTRQVNEIQDTSSDENSALSTAAEVKVGGSM